MFDNLRWQDAVDVAILTFVLFRAYVWLRGTVALQVAAGMLTLAAAAFAADQAGLVLTAYVLQGIGAASLVVAVVIFRDEIRRALGRASPLRWWRERRARARNGDGAPAGPWTPLADALHELARKKIGALVVVPRGDPVNEHLTGGTRVECVISTPVIEAIFHTGSPMHDGAAVIEGDRVRLCGAFLPLTEHDLPTYGTRHRAAVGISERCDAVALCVSEQRGEISIAVGGKITKQALSASVLARRLRDLVAETDAPDLGPGRAHRRAERRRRIIRDAVVAVAIFGAVVFAWDRVANRRGATRAPSTPAAVPVAPAAPAPARKK